jgi:hypothetical protein
MSKKDGVTTVADLGLSSIKAFSPNNADSLNSNKKSPYLKELYKKYL